MAVLHDTNILHRAGEAGLAFARREAWAFLAKGGAGADFLAAAYFGARLQLIGPG